MQAARAQVFY
jgi:hypothetical protein